MVLIWISFITSVCWFAMSGQMPASPEFLESTAVVLPGPLPMLAGFWLHMIPVALIARRDGRRLRDMRSSCEME
jgi:hypothetical protein